VHHPEQRKSPLSNLGRVHPSEMGKALIVEQYITEEGTTGTGEESRPGLGAWLSNHRLSNSLPIAARG